MSRSNLRVDTAAHYRICTEGLFDPDWLDLLSGAWVICTEWSGDKDTTILVGDVADQAALMGVLTQLYHLGFPLLLVECLADQDQAAR